MGATREVPLTAKQRGKTAPAKLAHIVYKTSRYEKMIEWYQVGFGKAESGTYQCLPTLIDPRRSRFCGRCPSSEV